MMDDENMTYNSTNAYDYNYDDYGDVGICQYGKPGAYFLPALYSLLFVFGLVGNGLVFWVVLMCVKIQSMTDVCLLNLASADLLLLFSLPFLAHYSRDQWVFGRAMCKMVLSGYHIGFFGGIFFITLMSIDRYLAIVHAVYALKVRTRTYGALASFVVWMVSILVAFPEILYTEVTNGTQIFCTSIGEQQNMTLFNLFKLNILGLLLPLIVMGFCYLMIMKRLVSCRQAQSKTIRLVVLVVVAFFCCWTPYNITSFFKALEMLGIYTGCKSSKAIHLSLQVTEAVAYSHTCLNPIIYVFVGRKFRRHLSRLLGRLPCAGCQALKKRLTPIIGSMVSQSTTVEDGQTGM
ncbi:C-C chemokine receptor type 2 [Megalops cyprinoides]|uniref:C-C chemokine receptor type 2 n=1 Tax=Megalops cyprinoides TaxID=118141 RepID=UPI001863BB65|nr:C-C chemokine receptor type 2 [Megalops cyprinoides]